MTSPITAPYAIGSHPLSVLAPINVVAPRLGLTPRALRHYEALGLLRSERDFSNTRHYDSETVATLEAIAFLRKADIPIARIRAIIALRHDRPLYLQAIRETLTDAAEHKERSLATLREALGDLESVFTPLSRDVPSVSPAQSSTRLA